MPRLSRWMVRTSLVHLALGLAAGAVLLAGKGVPTARPWAGLRPLHVELLLVGWTMQLAMGVAHWILPRLKGGGSRGDPRPALAAYLLLNAGVALVAASGPGDPAGVLPLAGRLCEAASAVAFAIHAWPRIAPLDDLMRR